MHSFFGRCKVQTDFLTLFQYCSKMKCVIQMQFSVMFSSIIGAFNEAILNFLTCLVIFWKRVKECTVSFAGVQSANFKIRLSDFVSILFKNEMCYSNAVFCCVLFNNWCVQWSKSELSNLSGYFLREHQRMHSFFCRAVYYNKYELMLGIIGKVFPCTFSWDQ